MNISRLNGTNIYINLENVRHIEYTIDEDVLYRDEPTGNNSYKRTEVIDKDAFIACYNAWIKQEDDLK